MGFRFADFFVAWSTSGIFIYALKFYTQYHKDFFMAWFASSIATALVMFASYYFVKMCREVYNYLADTYNYYVQAIDDLNYVRSKLEMVNQKIKHINIEFNDMFDSVAQIKNRNNKIDNVCKGYLIVYFIAFCCYFLYVLKKRRDEATRYPTTSPFDNFFKQRQSFIPACCATKCATACEPMCNCDESTDEPVVEPKEPKFNLPKFDLPKFDLTKIDLPKIVSVASTLGSLYLNRKNGNDPMVYFDLANSLIGTKNNNTKEHASGTETTETATNGAIPMPPNSEKKQSDGMSYSNTRAFENIFTPKLSDMMKKLVDETVNQTADQVPDQVPEEVKSYFTQGFREYTSEPSKAFEGQTDGEIDTETVGKDSKP
jgi:hypothetical protein